ncbi:MAG: carbohydrate kinase family protein [Lachnospiraceae bacterium]|nr:carbohydrate kinase family protein [Candidatus Colinaster scatohippi]
MGIVVIGSTFVDIKGYPLGQYIPDGRNAGNIEQVHGGVARNVVENIANIELRPMFVSLVDDNGAGLDVINKLNRHKVDTTYVKQTKDGMGVWLALFDHTGNLAGSISKRPDLQPIYNILLEHGDEIISQADSVALELDLEKDVVKEVFRLAEKYNKQVFAVISNMSIALERRDFFQKLDCFVCNQQEAGMLFVQEMDSLEPEQLMEKLPDLSKRAGISKMIVTMGAKGAVYYSESGELGICKAHKVDVIDTTGAGDAFFSGVTAGITYGKSLRESCEIGTRLSASVISTKENVCPRFRPEEFGLQ